MEASSPANMYIVLPIQREFMKEDQNIIAHVFMKLIKTTIYTKEK